MTTVSVKTDNNMRIFYVSESDSYIRDHFSTSNTRKFITKFKKKFCPV
jgi:hypothetical protein